MKRTYSWIIVAIAVILYFTGRHLYFKPSYSDGETAPMFTSTLANGEHFQLDQLRGKYVVLDFWGSWCGPCIGDFPILRDLHRKYHGAPLRNGSGFEIVGIGVEQSADRWHRALDRLAPEWPYQILDTVTSLRFFDGELTKEFGVKQLPAIFLLNPDGKIIGTRLTFDKIDKILASELIQ